MGIRPGAPGDRKPLRHPSPRHVRRPTVRSPTGSRPPRPLTRVPAARVDLPAPADAHPLACRDSQRIASRHRIDPARGDSRAAAGHRVRSLVLAVRRSADAHPTQRHRRARLRSRAWPLRLPTGTVRRASAPIAAKSSPEYSSSSERPDGDPRAHRRSGVGNQPSAGRAQAPPPRPRPRCALV
jgi:hypothetical protein